MPYAVLVWKRGTTYVQIAGLKKDDLEYLTQIPCLKTETDVSQLMPDGEGFYVLGTQPDYRNPKSGSIQPSVVLTALEVLGFKVVTNTNHPAHIYKWKSGSTETFPTFEYVWTLRREFEEPEPNDCHSE